MQAGSMVSMDVLAAMDTMSYVLIFTHAVMFVAGFWAAYMLLSWKLRQAEAVIGHLTEDCREADELSRQYEEMVARAGRCGLGCVECDECDE